MYHDRDRRRAYRCPLATAGDNHLGGDDFDECPDELLIVEEYRKKKNQSGERSVAFHRNYASRRGEKRSRPRRS